MDINSSIQENELEIAVKGLRTGMSQTLGNFLRRSYLLEDSGTQLIAVKINDGDVITQFQSISGVVEDAQAIISNLQLVEFSKAQQGKILTGSLSSNTEAEVKASALNITPLTVNNPNKVILRKRPEVQVTLNLYLLNDKGFRTKDQNLLLFQQEGISTEGLIVLDSNHKTIDKAWFDTVEESSLTETMIFKAQSTKGGLTEISESIFKILKELESAFK